MNDSTTADPEQRVLGRLPKTRLASLLESLRSRGWEPGAVAGWDEADVGRVYGRLIKSQFNGDNLPLACVATELLAARQPDTVRGIMYAVVSAGWLPDTGEKSYNRIQRLLKALRTKNVVPYKWIVDNIRHTIKPSSWTGLKDFVETVQDAYRLNFWASLPTCVEIIVEKDTVAGRIEPVTREYDVALRPLRGYSSTSFAWGIAEQWRRINKPITVYYIGDHDPSGRDIERSVIESLTELSGKSFAWKRLAVEPEHFDRFGIIPLAPKVKDRRYTKFVRDFGERCAEVEAVPADALRDMVREAIESHIPAEQWARLTIIEAAERREWADVMAKIGGGR